jgi:hypothetical protein
MSWLGVSLSLCPASQNTTLQPLAVKRSEIAAGANAVNSGTCTAPNRQMAKTLTRWVRLLPISVAMRSPARSPTENSAAIFAQRPVAQLERR